MSRPRRDTACPNRAALKLPVAFHIRCPALLERQHLFAGARTEGDSVACHRDAMTQFLGYATQLLGTPRITMQLIDITPELVLKVLAQPVAEHGV